MAAKTGHPRPILAAKFGPGGPVLAKFLPKSVRGTSFWGTDFGVTVTVTISNRTVKRNQHSHVVLEF